MINYLETLGDNVHLFIQALTFKNCYAHDTHLWNAESAKIIVVKIDGFFHLHCYNRLKTFLQVSTNNLASTILSAFLSGIDEFGLPL